MFIYLFFLQGKQGLPGIPGFTGPKVKFCSIYNAVPLSGVYRKGCYVISESCYEGTIVQRNDRKRSFYGYFPIIPFVKFHG